MKIFITGKPGSGKSTVFLKFVKRLRNASLRIGGIVTTEIRVNGHRTGFKIIDLLSGRIGILASVNQPIGPKVSKYRVNLNDIDVVAVDAIEKALLKADLVAIDELGPMEFYSKRFEEAVKKTLSSGKPLLATMHFRLRHPLLERIRRMNEAKIFTVKPNQIENLTENLSENILKKMEHQIVSE